MLTIIPFRICYDNALYVCMYVATLLSNHSIRVTHDKQNFLLYNRMFDCSIRVYQSAFGNMPVFIKVLLIVFVAKYQHNETSTILFIMLNWYNYYSPTIQL